MTNLKTIVFLMLIVVVSFGTSGCVKLKTGNNASGVDGGVFISGNKGLSWQQSGLIKSVSGAPGSLANTSMLGFEIDPSDYNALYYTTYAAGVYYSYDKGKSWEKINALGNVQVRAITVDPKSKCTIYATVANTVKKSVDCGRTWSQMYYDNSLSTIINSVEVDHYDSNIVYAGLSRGELIKSSDGGKSWKTINRINDLINKIIIHPRDSRKIYVVGNQTGIHFSDDSGENWDNMNSALSENAMGTQIKNFLITGDGGKIKESLFIATNYGIIKSEDNGETWMKIPLILPNANATVNAVAVNPLNEKEMYYVTNTTFYSSVDSGENWTTRKLPTSRFGTKLIMDPENKNMLFMGVFKPAK